MLQFAVQYNYIMFGGTFEGYGKFMTVGACALSLTYK